MTKIIFYGILIAVFGFFLRIKPRLGKEKKGVDTWYFLSCVREYKKTHKIPTVLKNYLLEIDEQWYPPGFIIFLSILPQKVLEKYHWLINPIIDTIQLVIVYIFSFLCFSDIKIAIISSLIYATAPTLISECSTLTSRLFGNLNFTLFLLSIFYFISTSNIFWFLLVLGLGFLLLMTHKMAVQNFLFIMLGMSLIFLDWRYLAILAGIFLFTLIFSKGFYLKILKAHKEILLFWKKNLNNLGVHQIYDSKIYKKENIENRRLFPVFHQKGLKGIIRHLVYIFGYNPWILLIAFVPFSVSLWRFDFFNFLFWWVILTYLFVFLTTFFLPMRFLGEGYKYIKMGIFPLAILIAVLLFSNLIPIYLFIALLLLNLFLIFRFVGKTTVNVQNEDLLLIFDFLKNEKKDGIMLLPTHLADAIAYLTNKKVLWGTHGSDGTGRWAKIEEFFPVIQKPIEYFFEKYDLHFLLIDKNYVEPEDLKLNNRFAHLITKANYSLFEYLTPKI